MPVFNLLYYSKNFRKTTGSFWNYYSDIPGSEHVVNNERARIFYPISSGYSKIFNDKTKFVGTLPDGEDELENIKIVVPF